jgi:hypothetical protein
MRVPNCELDQDPWKKNFEPKIFLLNWKAANPFRVLRREGINQNTRLTDYKFIIDGKYFVVLCLIASYFLKRNTI